MSDKSATEPFFSDSCPSCGIVQIECSELTLVRDVVRDAYFYRFKCPKNDELLFKNTSHRIAKLLIAEHVAFELLDLESEREKEVLPIGISPEPIAIYELLDFSVMLHQYNSNQVIRLAISGGYNGEPLDA